MEIIHYTYKKISGSSEEDLVKLLQPVFLGLVVGVAQTITDFVALEEVPFWAHEIPFITQIDLIDANFIDGLDVSHSLIDDVFPVVNFEPCFVVSSAPKTFKIVYVPQQLTDENQKLEVTLKFTI